MLTSDDIREIEGMIDRKEASRDDRAFATEAARREFEKWKLTLAKDTATFLGNYRVLNATSVGRVLPKGTLFVVDAGTTPSRSISLVYSDGQRHFNLTATVV